MVLLVFSPQIKQGAGESNALPVGMHRKAKPSAAQVRGDDEWELPCHPESARCEHAGLAWDTQTGSGPDDFRTRSSEG